MVKEIAIAACPDRWICQFAGLCYFTNISSKTSTIYILRYFRGNLCRSRPPQHLNCLKRDETLPQTIDFFITFR
jgi:hypothetical protein